MDTFVAGQPYVLDEQILELERVRDVLITTVLEARLACETGSNRPGSQLLLSAAVKDVETVDEQLHTLRTISPMLETGSAAWLDTGVAVGTR